LPHEQARHVHRNALGEADHARCTRLTPKGHAASADGEHVAKPAALRPLKAMGHAGRIGVVGRSVRFEHRPGGGEQPCSGHAEALADR
jgi:hypothetical protein